MPLGDVANLMGQHTGELCLGVFRVFLASWISRPAPSASRQLQSSKLRHSPRLCSRGSRSPGQRWRRRRSCLETRMSLAECALLVRLRLLRLTELFVARAPLSASSAASWRSLANMSATVPRVLTKGGRLGAVGRREQRHLGVFTPTSAPVSATRKRGCVWPSQPPAARPCGLQLTNHGPCFRL